MLNRNGGESFLRTWPPGSAGHETLSNMWLRHRKYGLTAQERSAEKYRSIEQTPRAVVSLLVVFAVLALIIWGIVALVGGGGGGASLEGHFISWIPEDSAHGY